MPEWTGPLFLQVDFVDASCLAVNHDTVITDVDLFDLASLTFYQLKLFSVLLCSCCGRLWRWPTCSLLKMGHLRPPFRRLCSILFKLYNFEANVCQNGPFTIRWWGSNSGPLNNEFPPLTTRSGVTTLLWNDALWLVNSCHVTCNTQLQLFISEYGIYPTLKYFYEIGSLAAWPYFNLTTDDLFLNRVQHDIVQLARWQTRAWSVFQCITSS